MNECCPQHRQQEEVNESWRKRDYTMRHGAGKKILETGSDEHSGIGVSPPFDHKDPTFDAVWRRFASLAELVADRYGVSVTRAREALREAGHGSD